MKAFNEFNITVRTLEGGNLVSSSLLLDGQIVDASERVVGGKPGTTALSSRLRKAIKAAADQAFPREIVVASGEIPGQQVLPGTV